MLPYAATSGMGGALIVDLCHEGLSRSARVVEICLAELVFVVLGNPSVGGPYPAAPKPTFWRVICAAASARRDRGWRADVEADSIRGDCGPWSCQGPWDTLWHSTTSTSSCGLLPFNEGSDDWSAH